MAQDGVTGGRLQTDGREVRSSGTAPVTSEGRQALIPLCARYTAALTIATHTSEPPWTPGTAKLFRIAEYCANPVLLFMSSWVIHYAWVAGWAFVFFYLPAVTRSWTPTIILGEVQSLGTVIGKVVSNFLRPIKMPLLNFVVDDFSILGLHPKPRDATAMYAIMLFRVTFLVTLMLTLAYSAAFQVDVGVLQPFAQLANFHGINILFHPKDNVPPELDQRIPWSSQVVWTGLCIIILVFTALWIVTTFVMLCTGGFRKEHKDVQTIGEIDALALQLERCTRHDDWRKSAHALKRLSPPVKLTTLLGCIPPGVGSVINLLVDVKIGYTLFAHAMEHQRQARVIRDFVVGGLVTFNMLATLVYNTIICGNPLGIIPEIWRSYARGMITENYLKILVGDMGGHAWIGLGCAIHTIPFVAKETFGMVGIVVAIILTILFCAPEISNEFDLGIERLGKIRKKRTFALLATEVEMADDTGSYVAERFWPPRLV